MGMGRGVGQLGISQSVGSPGGQSAPAVAPGTGFGGLGGDPGLAGIGMGGINQVQSYSGPGPFNPSYSHAGVTGAGVGHLGGAGGMYGHGHQSPQVGSPFGGPADGSSNIYTASSGIDGPSNIYTASSGIYV